MARKGAGGIARLETTHPLQHPRPGQAEIAFHRSIPRERRDGAWIGVEVKLGGDRAIAEAVANLAKLRSRLTEPKLAQLASLCVITGGQTSFTRPDGIHVIALAHLRP